MRLGEAVIVSQARIIERASMSIRGVPVSCRC
jgi:hypothetical protein